jgi:membrane protein DedA with SNARE-associated domain
MERNRTELPRRVPVPPLGALIWSALLLAPVLYLVELAGPRWLNLALRGIWVGVVAVIAALVVLQRSRPTDRGRHSGRVQP